MGSNWRDRQVRIVAMEKMGKGWGSGFTQGSWARETLAQLNGIWTFFFSSFRKWQQNGRGAVREMLEFGNGLKFHAGLGLGPRNEVSYTVQYLHYILYISLLKWDLHRKCFGLLLDFGLGEEIKHTMLCFCMLCDRKIDTALPDMFLLLIFYSNSQILWILFIY